MNKNFCDETSAFKGGKIFSATSNDFKIFFLALGLGDQNLLL